MDAWILVITGAVFLGFVIAGFHLWWPARNEPSSRSSIGAAILTGAIVSFAIFMLQVVTDMRLTDLEARRASQQAVQDLRLQVAISPSLEGFDFGREASDLSGFYFAAKKLSEAKFRDLVLDNADFRGANLARAEFDGSSLRGVSFLGANLENAKLPRAMLVAADFTGACLRGVDLAGADLTGADLTSADLSSATFDAMTVWPGGDRRSCTRDWCTISEKGQPAGACT